MTDFHTKINQFIQFKGITRNAFEKSIGCSSNYLGNTKNLSAKVVESILRTYPELSSDWIMLGKGEMIRVPTNDKIAAQEAVIQEMERRLVMMEVELKTSRQREEMLMTQVSALNETIFTQKKLIEMMENTHKDIISRSMQAIENVNHNM
ncbi:MAG: hypothetical protein LIP09_04910 [Bacteroidales bacterium]|nr:hypothetical protein [Bacteroidales bacterium]